MAAFLWLMQDGMFFLPRPVQGVPAPPPGWENVRFEGFEGGGFDFGGFGGAGARSKAFALLILTSALLRRFWSLSCGTL